uniref:Uncharacterized protein n=1 Tax=uncultured prokaryote TaxID=198431 RepID=A0A0H5QNQ9_9ZZZZ|nr:hypothetical protein [uncultured prokaryote]
MFRTQLVWSGLDGPNALTTLYFQSPGLIEDQDSVNLAVENIQAALAVAKEDWHSAVRCTPTGDAVVIDPATGEYTDFFTYSAGAFTGGGQPANDHMPALNQMLLRMNSTTIKNNRRIKGHLFLPGSMEINSDSSGNVDPTVRARQATAYELLIDTEVTVVVWSRPTAESPVGVAAPVVGMSVDAGWSFLRGRR